MKWVMHVSRCVYQISPVLSQDTEKCIESNENGQCVPYKALVTQIIDT